MLENKELNTKKCVSTNLYVLNEKFYCTCDFPIPGVMDLVVPSLLIPFSPGFEFDDPKIINSFSVIDTLNITQNL